METVMVSAGLGFVSTSSMSSSPTGTSGLKSDFWRFTAPVCGGDFARAVQEGH
jgi:hypothetical protein